MRRITVIKAAADGTTAEDVAEHARRHGDAGPQTGCRGASAFHREAASHGVGADVLPAAVCAANCAHALAAVLAAAREFGDQAHERLARVADEVLVSCGDDGRNADVAPAHAPAATLSASASALAGAPDAAPHPPTRDDATSEAMAKRLAAAAQSHSLAAEDAASRGERRVLASHTAAAAGLFAAAAALLALRGVDHAEADAAAGRIWSAWRNGQAVDAVLRRWLTGWGIDPATCAPAPRAGDVPGADARRLVADFEGPRPPITVLCGSTRFGAAFAEANLRLTLAGHIVLSIKPDGDLLGDDAERARVKAELDELHKRKIDRADRVLVLNLGGHIGESTASEIAYAKRLGKPIERLEAADALA
jgi:hypothetical protein